jgi:hypothetical protein
MENEKNLPQELEKLLTNQVTRKQLDDLAWLLEHPEYEHRVVGIREFIDSPEYLNCGGECWPNIKDDLEALFNGNYTEAVFCQAIGSGKSFASSIIIAYLVYRLLCLKDPQGYLGMARGSCIYFLNMSIRAEQSKKVVFGEVKSRIDNSPWFQRHYPPDPDIRSELHLPKNIIIFPGNSKETFPLGYNIFAGIMDEAAWYIDTDNHDVAEDMFNALHSRIKNRFGDKGILVMISSPRYVDDFIEKKMGEAETNKQIFASRKMLWQSKPLDKFSGNWIDFEGYKIPAELETEARRNPEAFKRDYMAIPSLALEPYFKQFVLVEQSIDPKLEHPIDEQGKLKSSFKRRSGNWHFIHVDLSHKRDATGIAMVHAEEDTILTDLMLRIKAPPGGEIFFSQIREIIFEIRNRGFEIYCVTFDGWQSIDSIQILKDKGFRCEVLSVDKDTAAYDTLKDKIYNKKFKCYLYEPFFQEMRRLELIEGKKVDHPPLGSKDVADAVAGAVYNCVANSNNFQYWFGGDTLKHKTEEEIKKESEVLTKDSLVPYGYWANRRLC